MRPVCKPESFLERRKFVLQVSDFYKTLVLCKTLIWDEKGCRLPNEALKRYFPMRAPN